jgi:LysM repeat protein
MSLGRIFSWWIAVLVAIALSAGSAWALGDEGRAHRVEKGQTLGGIAKRYGVSIEALCKANRIRRTDPIRPGQRLVIPSKDEKEGKPAQPVRQVERLPDADWKEGQQRLEVPGAPPVYYYEPMGAGRLGLRPVFMVLHGRGGSASNFCSRWAPVVRSMGWLVCPSAPHAHGPGHSWLNDWGTGRRIVQAAHQALRGKYGRRVQLYGNTLIGFSEGAFVAMNVGVRESREYNRWLILAADDGYWGSGAPELLGRARGRLKRVYLVTGKQDGAHAGTLRTQALLRSARIPVRLSDPSDMGHVVELESKRSMYQAALTWLNQ